VLVNGFWVARAHLTQSFHVRPDSKSITNIVNDFVICGKKKTSKKKTRILLIFSLVGLLLLHHGLTIEVETPTGEDVHEN